MTRARVIACVPFLVLALAVGGACGASPRPAVQRAAAPDWTTNAAADLRDDLRARQRPARVRYTGPHRLAGRVGLRASVHAGGARVVAVTFLIAGSPVGTDTTAPYRLDVDAARLPRGRHGVQVEAVDRLGVRARSALAGVSVGGAPRVDMTVTPGHGLQAATAALRRGHATVALGPGRYEIGHLRLGPGAILLGAGPSTVLAAANGANAFALVSAHGRRIRIADLAVDGAGRTDRAIAVVDGSADVRISRVHLSGMRLHGVDTWGVHSDVSVQDSVIAGGGAAAGAGVTDLGSDHSRDTSVVRTQISGFRGWGIDFAQREYQRPAAALHNVALDNRISDIDDPTDDSGTKEGGIWSGGVAAAIVGNVVRRAGIDGIQTVGSSTRVSVVGNDVAETPVGIYLEHETHDSLFMRNAIAGVRTGINVEYTYDNAGSSNNVFAANRIIGASATGVFVDLGADFHRIVDNVIGGAPGAAVILQGSSHNLVSGNVACAGGAPEVVREQPARLNGRIVVPNSNRVVGNRRVDACPGG